MDTIRGQSGAGGEIMGRGKGTGVPSFGWTMCVGSGGGSPHLPLTSHRVHPGEEVDIVAYMVEVSSIEGNRGERITGRVATDVGKRGGEGREEEGCSA
ncbi:hypothetical protein Tco_1337491 [Tanacetum coccineum]